MLVYGRFSMADKQLIFKVKTTYLYLFIHENSKWITARRARTAKDVCMYTHIPNNTTPFALNLLSQISFADMWAGALTLNSS